MNIQDDNEAIRYLASYICSHEQEILITSFDRNGSHNAGEYKEITFIDYDKLHQVIRDFYDNLL